MRKIKSYKKIHLTKDWGLFLGTIKDNSSHKHYAIQINISINQNINVTCSRQSNSYKSVIIKSNYEHKVNCLQEHLLILINPTSQLGHYFNQNINGCIESFNHDLAIKLEEELKSYSIHFSQSLFFKNVNRILEDIKCLCLENNHYKDDRIPKALKYLDKNYDKIVPLEEIADYCCLSPSRFIHLFKAKVGISYRRAQLWNKISKSMVSLPNHSITEVAHLHGFSDSAHYSKVFKENFGFSPRQIMKL